MADSVSLGALKNKALVQRIHSSYKLPLEDHHLSLFMFRQNFAGEQELVLLNLELTENSVGVLLHSRALVNTLFSEGFNTKDCGNSMVKYASACTKQALCVLKQTNQRKSKQGFSYYGLLYIKKKKSVHVYPSMDLFLLLLFHLLGKLQI